ncbi:MAG: hypothetical protein M1835_006707 [Candelina submexicana]|nr:MAG: hypothetical protein M1835_006707 [Candelina submexicana]
MERLVKLPEILLQVVENSDIPTLLNLYVTTKGIHHLILSYEASICGIIAECCYPQLFGRLTREAKQSLTVKKLSRYPRWDISRMLAAVAVGSVQHGTYPGIPLDNPLGDEIRSRVEHGWLVAWDLSDIARKLEAAEDQVQPKGLLYTVFGTSRLQDLETAIFSRWHTYVKGMSADDLFDLELSQLCRDGRFLPGGEWGEWARPLRPRVNQVVGWTWAKGYILREGPLLVSRLWHSDESIRAEAEIACKEVSAKRSKERIVVEDTTIKKHWEDLREQHPNVAHQHVWMYYQSAFRAYSQHCKNAGTFDVSGPPLYYSP